ncbi:hypothetical protein XM38_029500 [Halomicronema hongdechloris C2206]|uniref:Uncharacterized protein n=1 Tax=Halomicronema hongdechloris C2206 TaxID=1641165 RepID=A0A1Z3HNY3_9CYAN|nr:hypothetical protein [Halomicronema hongdechloris]ASC71996.1 hypothetical protein XM38_029500 [Halomicronema hongdechloris C2206]
MLSSLLTRLHRRYPTASLTADLLMVHDGNFVVRSQVAINGIVVASSLAAATTVEAAEDRAKLRALQAIDLGDTTDPPSPKSDAFPESEATPAPPAKSPPPAAAKAPAPANKSSDSPTEEPTQPPAAPASAQATPPKPDPTTTHPCNGSASPPQPSAPPTSVNNAAAPTAPGDTPIDLSDIIAQTDVELQRLGWTVAQGREYLEATYGKRSRHDLSDEELLEFLLHLEAQPSP